MKKKLAIVGGGITGCALAIIFLKKDYEVSIYDSASSIGGVLKDLVFDNEFFFNGCQYLDADSNWFKSVLQDINFKDDMYFFQCKYGSYCDFDGVPNYSSDFPEAIFTKKIEKIDLNNNKNLTLYDRFETYPELVSKHLKTQAKKFGINLKNLTWKSAENGLMASRIFLQNNLDELKLYKKKNVLADALYGIPKKYLNLKAVNVAVPKFGYNHFFLKLKNFLENKKIKIYNKTLIKSKWENGHFNLLSYNKKINCDKFIWTCNPTNLVRNFDGQKMDSVFVYIKMYTMNLDFKLKENFYVNVFSIKSSIFRAYVYNLNNKSKLTIECFNEDENIKNLFNTINNIFNITFFIKYRNYNCDFTFFIFINVIYHYLDK